MATEAAMCPRCPESATKKGENNFPPQQRGLLCCPAAPAPATEAAACPQCPGLWDGKKRWGHGIEAAPAAAAPAAAACPAAAPAPAAPWERQPA
eukprot:scaffold238929_cov16-Tisochrysis_lutea.AAC.1